jgi:hypothetical protein
MDYNKLLESLSKARKAGIEAAKGDDGGSANLDSVFLEVPYCREEKVLEIIQKAGLFCGHKIKWIGSYGYLISPAGCGQGNSRYRAVQAMVESLKKDGFQAMPFYMTD